MNFNNPYSREAYKDFFQNQFLTDDFKISEEKLSFEFTPQYLKNAFVIGEDKSLELKVLEVLHDSENDPRVGLSKDIFRLMSSYGYKRALVLLHSSKSKNYRLSLATIELSLEGSKVKKEYSNPRRYSFFLGPDAKVKTPHNFLISKGRVKDFEDLRKRFSIEAVTDDFYNEFKPNFDRLSESVDGTKDKQLKQDFALLFIIRTIFLGFVQKKLWLNKDEEFIINYWREYKEKYYCKNLFYSQWLRPLFFESLNSPPGRKVFNRTTPFSESTALALQMAPYLNGELFKEKTGIDDKELSIPDKSIEQFFDFLFSYNFTIEENTLYDQDLELNPEFLGIIFERLVNKEDGAVYTPRTEVDFICRISLVKWLEKVSNIHKKKLYHLLFDKHNEHIAEEIFNENEKTELLTLLKNVTIADPAVGSGAFPVGMLQVLDETIRLLSKEENENAFERKKEIISRSLYGVEVKAWAVWICQLRLWLSLFIDMPDEFSKSFEPLLPNLEFKIRRGDSIVQKIGDKIFPVDSHANISSSIKRKITELKKEKSDFFYGGKRATADLIKKKENDIFKEIIQEQIFEKKRTLKVFSGNEPVEDIFGNVSQKAELKLELDEKKKEQIKEEISLLEEELNSFKEEHPLIWNIEFAEIFYDKNGFDIIIGNPPYVRQEQISDPNGKHTPIEYKELLRKTIYEEYPDYFYTNKLKAKLKIKIDGKSDLYTFFYLKSLKLLNEKGVLTFICSNSWLDVGYGKWLQQFILENSKLLFVIDNHAKRSFASADVNTIITVLDAPNNERDEKHKVKFIVFKKPFEEVLNTENLLLNEYAETITKDDDFRVYPITYKELKEAGTVYGDENDEKLGNGIYEGDKWGGKYLRAPDIFFTILEKGKDKLTRLYRISNIEGYIHDNNTGPKFPKVKFIKTVKQLDCILLTMNSKAIILYGVKKEGNSRLVSPILFPRTLGDRQLVVWNKAGIYAKEFYKIIPNSMEDIVSVVSQLNSTFVILQRELFGLTNLGDGALKFSAYDIGLFYIIQEIFIDEKEIENFLNRKQKEIIIELGFDKTKPIRSQKPNPLPDRKALDDIIFDAIGLTQAEREEVYYSVCELVQNRLNKARSV